MSLTFFTSKGSVESLKDSTWWGWSRKARQIREIEERDRPLAAAIERVDHCVASLGVASRVLPTTHSAWAWVIVGGAPGRGSSLSPASRRAKKRGRHLPTVCCVTRKCSASAGLLSPLAP